MTDSAHATSSENYVLGIDGGGSKTVAWLAERNTHPQTNIVGRGTAGPSNPSAVGFEKATRTVQGAIENAFADAGTTPQTVRAAVLSLAGSQAADQTTRLVNWVLNQTIAATVRVVSDAEPVLAAGTAEGVGIALICGTGSYAFGRSSDGTVAAAGGYGYLLGDEGGGYWMGRAAVASALRELDGSGAASNLTDQVLAHLRASTAAEIKQRVYGCDDPRHAIASIAPLATTLAEQGDDTAEAIVDRAAAALGRLVVSVAGRLTSLPDPLPVALAGSVLLRGGTRLLGTLEQRLLAAGLTAQFTQVPEPVAGCVALAARDACD